MCGACPPADSCGLHLGTETCWLAHDALLSPALPLTQHRWDAGAGSEQAYFFNHLQPGAVVVRNERTEMLCQGQMVVADAYCAGCAARIGERAPAAASAAAAAAASAAPAGATAGLLLWPCCGCWVLRAQEELVQAAIGGIASGRPNKPPALPARTAFCECVQAGSSVGTWRRGSTTSTRWGGPTAPHRQVGVRGTATATDHCCWERRWGGSAWCAAALPRRRLLSWAWPEEGEEKGRKTLV